MNREKIKKAYKTIMLIIVVVLVTFIVTSVFLYNKLGTSEYEGFSISSDDLKLINKINTIKTILNKKYVSEVDETTLIDSTIKGYISGIGDEYTEYFTKTEMEEFITDTEGNYVGIGVYMYKDTENNNIVVLSTIDNSPAQKVGLQTGDIIKKVNDIEYTGDDFEKIASIIKGVEGTTVKLEINRNDEIKTFEITREKIELYPIKSQILDNDIGYIKITSFNLECADKFKTVYNNLKNSNIKSLVIDLRNNGGGIVDEALEIVDYILEKGDIMLITKDKDENEEIKKSSNNPIIDVPVVVLTNKNTASASEIVAGALKENGKATIVGEKTYGKGLIQELITLSDGSGIKVTTEEYYTPNRNKINGIGIKPDNEVSLPEDVIIGNNIDLEKDVQLNEAIKTLRNK